MTDIDTKEIKTGQKRELRLTTGLLIFIVMQTLTAVWWAASITSEQNHISAAITRQADLMLTLQDGANLQLQIDNNAADVSEIKALLVRIEGKIDDLK